MCLVATAAVREVPQIGSLHPPTSCLCAGRNGSGRLELPFVVLVMRRDRDARVPDQRCWELVESGRMGADVHLWRIAADEELIESGRAALHFESCVLVCRRDAGHGFLFQHAEDIATPATEFLAG